MPRRTMTGKRKAVLAIAGLALIGAGAGLPALANAADPDDSDAQDCEVSFRAAGPDQEGLTASSGEFPIGSRIRVTNKDNDRSVEVEIDDLAGQCALLSPAAFDEIREPGKNLARNSEVLLLEDDSTEDDDEDTDDTEDSKKNKNDKKDKNDVEADTDADGDGTDDEDVEASGEPCQVTTTGGGGEASGSSGEFPIGSKVRITNKDNGNSTVVEITEAAGRCLLLNAAAFEEVREPGLFLIRNAVVERVD